MGRSIAPDGVVSYDWIAASRVGRSALGRHGNELDEMEEKATA